MGTGTTGTSDGFRVVSGLGSVWLGHRIGDGSPVLGTGRGSDVPDVNCEGRGGGGGTDAGEGVPYPRPSIGMLFALGALFLEEEDEEGVLLFVLPPFPGGLTFGMLSRKEE